MSRCLTPLLAVLVVLLLGGGVVAWATSGGEDPAPPARTADVPGVVGIARPIQPVRLDSGPSAELDARYREPGGPERTVATFRQLRTYGGSHVDRRCLVVGSEEEIRGARRLAGNCLDAAAEEPWTVGVGADSRGPVTISGIASSEVKQLSVAGPGGTFEVPRSAGGAFVVAYGKQASGRAVLSAELRDGTTRFYRTNVPPSFTVPGAARASDPNGLPDWTATEGQVRGGPACVAVRQDMAIRAQTPLLRGGLFLATVCGDLTRSPVIARTGRLIDLLADRPGSRARKRLPDRLVVAGAANRTVRSVSLHGPAGNVPLPLAAAGRAFVAVLPAGTRASALALQVELADGRVTTYPNPTSVGQAYLQRQPPYVLPKVRLTLPVDSTQEAQLSLRLSDSAARVSARIHGHRIPLHRSASAGRGVGYQGSFRPGDISGRLASRGGLRRLTVQSCVAHARCSQTLVRARVR